MSSFTTPLRGEFNDKMDSFTLTEEFVYHITFKDSGHYIRVPAGFSTDFASTPKWLHWMLPPTGIYGKAAVLHDYLYSVYYTDSREFADKIFLEAMLVLGVPKWKANTMYKAVRLFGGSHYKSV